MGIDQLVALASLSLSIFFWWNARQQAAVAEKTLQEIKSQIIGWQNELNKTAIEMLAGRLDLFSHFHRLVPAGTIPVSFGVPGIF